jgi:flagellar hook-length control protein FliK
MEGEKDMDKLWISSLNTGQPGESKKDKAICESGDDFSQLLEEQNQQMEKKDSARKSIADDKQPTPKEERKEQDARQQNLQAKMQARQKDFSPLINYLYNVAYKNVDTMTLSEKQSFKVEEFLPEGVGLKEFQRMLAQRGINLSSLSFDEIAQLVKRNSKEQLTSYLDDIVKNKWKEKDEQAAKGGLIQEKEAMAAKLEQKIMTSKETQDMNKTQREALIKQIMDKLDIRKLQEQTEVTIRLNPEHLGELKIKLEFKGGTTMAANFETASQEVRGNLQESALELETALKEQGLKVTNLRFTLVEELA